MKWTTTSHFNPALVDGAVHPAAGGIDSMPLDPLEMLFLEDAIKASLIPLPHFLVRFGIVRISQLPPSRVIEARDWIKTNSQKPAAA